MSASSYCACRTAALRIFVRGLVGPLPSPASARSTASRAFNASWISATTAAPRQWRSLSTASLPRYHSTTLSIAATPPARRRRRSQFARHASTVSEAVAPEAEAYEHVAPEATVGAIVPPDHTEAVWTAAPPDATSPLSTELPKETEPGTAPLGKNARKKLRKKKEQELLGAVEKPLEKSRESIPEGSVAAESLSAESTSAESRPAESPPAECLPTLEPALKQKKPGWAKTTSRSKPVRSERKTKAPKEGEGVEAVPSKQAHEEETGSLKVEKQARKEERRKKWEAEAVAATATTVSSRRPRPGEETWSVQKRALRAKFPTGWDPRKKLSPDAIEGIRTMHRMFPEQYDTKTLASEFQMSPEAIRRILKSSWKPSAEEEEAQQKRWFNRGKRIWTRWAETGRKPTKRWQAEGILRDPMSWPGGRKRVLERRAREASSQAGPRRPSPGKNMRLQNAAKRPAREPAKEPVKEPVKEPGREPVKEPAKEPALNTENFFTFGMKKGTKK